MTTRTVSKSQRDRFVKHLEDQKCVVRLTSKSGAFIRTPDGATTTVHFSTSDIRAKKNAIAWFRRHGIHHPDDTKEMEEVVTKNEEGYPAYLTGPINTTTRKIVLSELEAKGWPLRLRANELAMDSVTAGRALYAVGYRWDTDTTARNRYWLAPDEIREMHERVKAEMKEREDEARRQRQERALHALPPVTVRPLIPFRPPFDEMGEPRNKDAQDMQDAVSRETPEPGSASDTMIGAPGREVTPEVEVPLTRENVHLVEAAANLGKEQVPAAPEREFIDSVDSWTVDLNALPNMFFGGGSMSLEQYLMSLRSAGLEVEIRVWRKDRPEGENA